MSRIFDRKILNDGSSSDSDDTDYIPPEQVEVEGDDSESGEADLEPSSGGDTDVDRDRRKRKRKVRVRDRERRKKQRKSDDSCNDETTSNEAVTSLPLRMYSTVGTTSGTSSGGTGNTSTPSPGCSATNESVAVLSDAPSSVAKVPLAEVSTDQLPETTKAAPAKSKPATHATGLGALLASKKKKSTFDSVKAGWQQHVQEIGIGEELAQHNKGKEGFLNRKEFLEKANYREYEFSVNARTGAGSSTKRSSL